MKRIPRPRLYAPKHPLLENTTRGALDVDWTRDLSLTKGVRYPCATKAWLPWVLGGENSTHPVKKMPKIGIEPTTYGLQNRCSTVELCRLTESILLKKKLKVKSLSLRYNFLVMIRYLAPILLLTISNIFMTYAWYGHLKFKATPLLIVILVSWGIAFFEYCFQVPANRIGHEVYIAAQLKTIQEVITLIVFSFFSVLYLKEQFKWNYLVGFAFIILAAFFIFKKW